MLHTTNLAKKTDNKTSQEKQSIKGFYLKEQVYSFQAHELKR